MLGFLFTWSTENTEDVLTNVGGILGDLTPILIIIIAVGVGLIIVESVLSSIRGR